MKKKVYLSFRDDFQKMISVTPDLEKIIDKYEQGLLTYTETLEKIACKYVNNLLKEAKEETT